MRFYKNRKCCAHTWNMCNHTTIARVSADQLAHYAPSYIASYYPEMRFKSSMVVFLNTSGNSYSMLLLNKIAFNQILWIIPLRQAICLFRKLFLPSTIISFSVILCKCL